MRRSQLILALFALALALPATAVAAGAPRVSTGAASNVTSTSATLNGTVDPNGNRTTYRFEYGKLTIYGGTSIYGMSTAPVTVSGKGKQSASQSITGLAPSTTYHFRIVATNSAGEVVGADRTFTTLAGPPPVPGPGKSALSIAARPNPLVFGIATTISGRLTGAKHAGGVSVTLLQNPYPYTGGFKAVTSTTTSSQGGYAFTRKPKRNIRYKAVANPKQAGPVTSASLQVRVRMKVTLSLGDSTPARGQRVRFRGSVYPAHDGRVVYLQRRTLTGRYVTLARTRLRHVLGGRRSFYRRVLRIYRSGVYRAYVGRHADHSAGSRRRLIVVH